MQPIYIPSKSIALCMDVSTALRTSRHLFDDRYIDKRLYALLLVKAYLHYALNANQDRNAVYLYIINQAYELVFSQGLRTSPKDLIDGIQVRTDEQAYDMVAEVFASKIMRIFDQFKLPLENWFTRHPIDSRDHIEINDAIIKNDSFIIRYTHEPNYLHHQYSD